jgi:hypothetical protein
MKVKAFPLWQGARPRANQKVLVRQGDGTVYWRVDSEIWPPGHCEQADHRMVALGLVLDFGSGIR